jgi:hypothetical protein
VFAGLLAVRLGEQSYRVRRMPYVTCPHKRYHSLC